MTLTVYGIPNCDTVKKARNYLDARSLGYHFHDYKKAGAIAADLERWSAVVGWEKLLNKAGTTFKKLPDADKADIDAAKAIALMVRSRLAKSSSKETSEEACTTKPL